MEFVCEECGERGECFPSQKRRFCSLSCKGRWFGKQRDSMPTKPRRGTTEPCAGCGEPLYRSRGQTDKRYCSAACRDKGFRNGIVKPCEACGAPMYIVPSTGTRRFCDRKCYEANRIKRSGTGRQHNGREVIRDHDGYLRIWEPSHPSASQGRVLEHRWVVEQSIGRLLGTAEHVHHVNGIKDDNREENLAVLAHGEHSRLTGLERQAEVESLRQEVAEYRQRFGPLT